MEKLEQIKFINLSNSYEFDKDVLLNDDFVKSDMNYLFLNLSAESKLKLMSIMMSYDSCSYKLFSNNTEINMVQNHLRKYWKIIREQCRKEAENVYNISLNTGRLDPGIEHYMLYDLYSKDQLITLMRNLKVEQYTFSLIVGINYPNYIIDFAYELFKDEYEDKKYYGKIKKYMMNDICYSIQNLNRNCTEYLQKDIYERITNNDEILNKLFLNGSFYYPNEYHKFVISLQINKVLPSYLPERFNLLVRENFQVNNNLFIEKVNNDLMLCFKEWDKEIFLRNYEIYGKKYLVTIFGNSQILSKNDILELCKEKPEKSDEIMEVANEYISMF